MAGFIPEHTLDQVRQANDIVEVIGAYFPLKRAGANFRALCPFHKEKTPSFNVNQQKQIWHCFGCGEGGDVFKFVMKYENLDFIASVKRLAERAGVRLELSETPGRSASHDEKEALLKLHDNVATWLHENLLRFNVPRDYLAKRALSLDTAKRWRIGFSPDSWDALLLWAQEKQIPVPLLETAGLVVPSERGRYDRFRGRLMFSICDEQGRVIAFSGRILTDDKETAKYVNSPETPIFQKGKVLFALDKAKRAILDAKFAIVCEGQVDTISCHDAGIENVVAPQGTALTEHHARILKRYTDEVVLMFDADNAGQNAAVRSAEALLAAGLVIRVATLPGDHDPDSFIKQEGAEKLQAIIAGAPTFFSFFLDRLCQQLDPHSERGKVQITRQAVEWIVKIPNDVLRATYLQQTASRLDVPESAVRTELKKVRPRQTRDEPEPVEETTTAKPTGTAAEEILLQVMLADDRALHTVHEKLNPDRLTDSLAGAAIRQVLAVYAAGQWSNPSALLTNHPDDETTRLISRLLLQKAPEPERLLTATGDCLVAIERRWLESELRTTQKKLGNRNLSTDELLKLQQRFLDLRSKLDHIARLSVRKTSTSQAS